MVRARRRVGRTHQAPVAAPVSGASRAAARRAAAGPEDAYAWRRGGGEHRGRAGGAAVGGDEVGFGRPVAGGVGDPGGRASRPGPRPQEPVLTRAGARDQALPAQVGDLDEVAVGEGVGGGDRETQCTCAERLQGRRGDSVSAGVPRSDRGQEASSRVPARPAHPRRVVRPGHGEQDGSCAGEPARSDRTGLLGQAGQFAHGGIVFVGHGRCAAHHDAGGRGRAYSLASPFQQLRASRPCDRGDLPGHRRPGAARRGGDRSHGSLSGHGPKDPLRSRRWAMGRRSARGTACPAADRERRTRGPGHRVRQGDRRRPRAGRPADRHHTRHRLPGMDARPAAHPYRQRAPDVLWAGRLRPVYTQAPYMLRASTPPSPRSSTACRTSAHNEHGSRRTRVIAGPRPRRCSRAPATPAHAVLRTSAVPRPCRPAPRSPRASRDGRGRRPPRWRTRGCGRSRPVP